MLNHVLIAPPIAFVIVLLIVVAFNYLTSLLSFRGAAKADGKCKPYACGEEYSGQKIQPDYSFFFQFAFAFTIMHVIALFISTVPYVATDTYVIALTYVLAGLVGLFILFRRTH
jgi:NADH:ubiquinone oxidoreductase subunit 3 (subunit A)